MSAFVIRDATVADADSLAAIVQVLIADWLVPDGNVRALARMQQEHRPEAIALHIAEGWRHWLAQTATSEGSPIIVGYIALRSPAHLFNCYVKQDWHGQGIGKLLWQTLRNELQQRAEPVVTVNASLRSRGFYQRLGFVDEGEEKYVEGLRFQAMRCALSISKD